MSVVQVKMLSKQDGQVSVNPFKTKINTYYHVRLSARSATAAFDVCNAVDPGTSLAVPLVGQSFGAGGLIVLDTHPKVLGESGMNWEVQVVNGIDATITGTNIPPWTRKPIIEWSQVRYPWVLEKDLASTPVPVLNSAKDPFDPPIMTERINGLARFSWAQKTTDLDIDAVQSLVGTINSSSVTIRGKTYSAETCALRSASAVETVWSATENYWALVYEIEVKRQVDVKTLSVLDRGYHSLSGGVKYPIMINGVPASSPQLLDGSGGVLSTVGTPVYYPSGGFQIRASASWTALNLA